MLFYPFYRPGNLTESRASIMRAAILATHSRYAGPSATASHTEMMLTTPSLSYALDRQGIATKATIFANLGTAPLVEHAVRNGEGLLAKDGPFVVATGKHTGRSAKDKFIVKDAETENTVWWGKTNVPMTPEHF